MDTLDQALDLLSGYGDRTAFRFRTEFRSFPLSGAAAARRALRIAAALRDLGVGPRDRVVLRGPNGPDWGLSMLAVFRLGAVAVPLDAGASLDFTRRVAERVGAKAAVLSRFGAPGPADLPTLRFEDLDDVLERTSGPDPEAPTVKPSDTAEILFTSGTTGAPKGVVLTHRNIASNVASVRSIAPLDSDYVFLSMLPLSHMLEQTAGFFTPLVNGASVIYLDTLKPSAIVRALHDERVTAAVLVPRILKGLMLGILRETSSGIAGAAFSLMSAVARVLPAALRRLVFAPVHRKFGGRLRFLVSGGAPLEPETEAFWSLLGLEILQGYGLTETSPCLTIARPGEVVSGSVGQFLDSVEHRLGEDGELQVRGPNVFAGYLDDPETTAAVFDGDWFRTGDIAEVRDGHLFLRGRSKELIKTPGGLNVYPDDVEEALRKVDGVRDACVFPLAGPGGEEVGAALLPQPGHALDPHAVTAEANRHLEAGRGVARAFLWPEDDFPRTPTMKVRKFQVRKAIEEGGVDGNAVGSAGPDDPVLAAIVKLARRPAEEIDGGHRLGDDLGLDSLDLVDLVSSLEDRLHIDLDEGDVAPETTVDELRTLLKERRGVKDDPLPSWPRSAPALAVRWCFQHLVMLPAFRWFCRLEVRGLEHLEGLEGPVIFAPNHLSHFDTPALFAALPARWSSRTGAAAWKEYFEPEAPTLMERIWMPPIRLLMTVGLPMVPINQSRAFRRSLRNVGTMLDAGWNLIFFPEGERSRTGERLAFRQGIGVVGGAMRAPVVPVRLEGFGDLLPRDRFWPRRGRASVTFGEPLDLRGDDPATLTRRVEAAVDGLAG